MYTFSKTVDEYKMYIYYIVGLLTTADSTQHVHVGEYQLVCVNIFLTIKHCAEPCIAFDLSHLYRQF